MRVRTAQWIGFEARDTQEEDIIFVSFVQSFLLLGLKGRAYKDDIDVSIMLTVFCNNKETEWDLREHGNTVRVRKKQNLLDDRLEWAKLDQVCIGGMH